MVERYKRQAGGDEPPAAPVKEAPPKPRRDGVYLAPKGELSFISTGCTVLDCALGGGWPLGRVVNVVGDKSTGKTLLAIEAAANFTKQYPKGRIWYRESEAAFDEAYAEHLGLPLRRIDFGEEGLGSIWDTVEDVFEDLEPQLAALEKIKGKTQGLYIIDSLDALSSRPEMGRKVGEGSYALEKQKILGQMFREQVRRYRATGVTVFIISQVREKIGVFFGSPHSRSGGKSLDFYATQALWLSHLANITREIRGVKRVVGIRVRARCEKNKIAQPQRAVEFLIRFGFGIDDIEASLQYLNSVNLLKRASFLGKAIAKTELNDVIADVRDMPREEYFAMAAELRPIVIEAWNEVEKDFLPAYPKYA